MRTINNNDRFTLIKYYTAQAYPALNISTDLLMIDKEER